VDTDESPASNLSYLPRFSQPETRWPNPEPGQNSADSPETATSPSEQRTRKPGHAGTPTVISSLGDAKKPDSEQTTRLMIGALGLVVAGAVFLVKLRTKRKLRQPTKSQYRDIAEPLARLALRHADVSWLNPDLVDIIAAGSATGAYLNDGDLLEGSATDSGVPADLNQPEETTP
jgi:hypothetical protein